MKLRANQERIYNGLRSLATDGVLRMPYSEISKRLRTCSVTPVVKKLESLGLVSVQRFPKARNNWNIITFK